MMIDIVKESMREQFGASIDMLKNAIVMWPEESWTTKPKAFRMAFHTLYFIEFYLTIPPDNFTPSLPVTYNDDYIIPLRHYSKEEILDYLETCRAKMYDAVDGLNENNLDKIWLMKEWNRPFNYFELMLYNMRHVQHHAAQLNMMLRNEIDNAPDWVSRTSNPEA